LLTNPTIAKLQSVGRGIDFRQKGSVPSLMREREQVSFDGKKLKEFQSENLYSLPEVG
jgi:hypothetical protein